MWLHIIITAYTNVCKWFLVFVVFLRCHFHFYADASRTGG